LTLDEAVAAAAAPASVVGELADVEVVDALVVDEGESPGEAVVGRGLGVPALGPAVAASLFQRREHEESAVLFELHRERAL